MNYSIAYERGCNSGLTDAARHDSDPQNFEPTSNPYGCDSEAVAYDEWAAGYENAFEGAKGRR